MRSKQFRIVGRHIKIDMLMTRIRVATTIMVAALAIMTMGHGAMAHAPAGVTHTAQENADHRESACSENCFAHSHSMPVCCGMSLCLGALPLAPHFTVPIEFGSAVAADIIDIAPLWRFNRIDRPPKYPS